MKKNICKLFSLLLVSVICLSASVYAIDGSASAVSGEVISGNTMIDELFAKPFTLWNSEGKDITEEFYELMTPAYRMGDYATINEYVRDNVDQTKCVERAPYQPHVDEDLELITAHKANTIEITDIDSGRENNRFQYVVRVQYYYSAKRDIITDAMTPTMMEDKYGFFNDFGDPDPTIKVTGLKCTVATSGAYLTCSFNYDISFRVYVEGDPAASSLRYRYKGSTSVRINAGETY